MTFIYVACYQLFFCWSAKGKISGLQFDLFLSETVESIWKQKTLKSLPAETSAPPLASELFEAVAALLRLSTPAVILLRGLFVNNPHVYFDAYLENTTLVTDCSVYCLVERELARFLRAINSMEMTTVSSMTGRDSWEWTTSDWYHFQMK